jgi:predicted nicotinamide N-methyase
VLELLKPFQARLEGSSKIFLLGDQPRPHLTEQMKPFFAQSDIEDFSEADALWRILRDG